MITPNKYPSITITVPADIVEAMQSINLAESGEECDLSNPLDVESMGSCIIETYADYLDANHYPRRKPRQVKVADIEGTGVYVTVAALTYKDAAEHVAGVIKDKAQALFNV